ncbi:MAG: hypothetical protein MUE94_14195 [Verrucomicrobia bacterium]|nr:hypothetical protein [Verrucomicrobiota bacterium]
MAESLPPTSCPASSDAILQAHQLYCHLTGQSLRLGFDRERLWYELLRAGYDLEDLRSVIAYLQREIRAQRRNVGALKLSNLLQPDRFEEDLQISRVPQRRHSRPRTNSEVVNAPWNACAKSRPPSVNPSPP